MSLKQSFTRWLLARRRPTFFKLKKLGGLAITADDRFWDVHLRLLQEQRCTQTLHERYNLWTLAKATARLGGALAEVGVYRGGSAKLLCETGCGTPLHLFDTFEGMPKTNANTDGGFSAGDFADTSLENVRAYLSGYSDLHFHKGFFPDSASGGEAENLQYRLVHLDVDIRESTFNSLKFFYPRMLRGGVIVSHDYGQLTAPGVKLAYDEFFADKPETVIPLWDTQCVVTKC
jgi:O-methyltransferase